ncbi:MAG: tRNA glutamyl-Q(34) synthetase GluQRS [Wenzhouxiangellaceae bacterium]|nr:tRNA glutamyl-Q(34) synthetase GluQRS [Wenzhouxiangellaceae bacterium]
MVTASRRNKHPGNGYRGRFAPSPTGELHFGSLLAAVGSYAQARAAGGRWLVRIEDIDPPREVPGAGESQIGTLARFGMRPDEPVVWQSRSAPLHERAIAALRDRRLAFDCACTRRDLGPGGVYPGTCRDGIPPGRTGRSIRFRIPDAPVAVVDRVFGTVTADLIAECGDFVIRRADGLYAYQLAVVVDDIAAGITEVVRGRDLLDSSARQQALYQALDAPVPGWLHLPLVVDSSGRKLSKSGAADPVGALPPARTLRMVLQALGHAPPAGRRTLESIWRWAIANWDVARIPREPFEV